MPWKGVTVSEQRHRFLEDYLLNYYSVTELAERFSISRNKAHKWINRFMQFTESGYHELGYIIFQEWGAQSGRELGSGPCWYQYKEVCARRVENTIIGFINLVHQKEGITQPECTRQEGSQPTMILRREPSTYCARPSPVLGFLQSLPRFSFLGHYPR